MCTTTAIQKNIVRLGTRSFRNRMEMAGGGFDSARKLANLNRSIDKLYDCIYSESENMTGDQYNEFAPQLHILISTIKELYTCCRKSSFKEEMREEISELSKNYSALYELYVDLKRSFAHKETRLVDAELSGKVAAALKAI